MGIFRARNVDRAAASTSESMPCASGVETDQPVVGQISAGGGDGGVLQESAARQTAMQAQIGA